jgi:hypothetical protein
MIFSTKVVAQAATAVLTWGVALVVTKLGLHTSPDVYAAVPGLISLASGAFAGWFVREEAVLEGNPVVSHLEARVQGLYDSMPAPDRLALQVAAKDVVSEVATAMQPPVEPVDPATPATP